MKNKKMTIQLSDHFTYKKLIRFVMPSIGMMIFTSIYSVVDGFFVSNYAGSTQFASINLILPFLMIFSALGFMIGTGGTALVSMNLGMGRIEKANSIFSMLVYTVITIGIAVTIIGQFVLRDVAVLLGATEDMLPYCIEYGRIFLFAIGPFMLQTLFQSFLVVAERPKIGFVITLLAGITNMVLDYLLVGVFRFGVSGAAVATSMSMFVGGIIPLVYFFLHQKSTLHLGRTSLDMQSLLKACGNGFSEFLTNIALNVVAMAYNLQLLKYIGEKGVTTYGVIMYVCFIFIAIFIGYSMGMAPIVGYHFGANNENELKNIFRKSLFIIGISSVAMLALSQLLAKPLALLYVGYNQELMDMTIGAFKLYSVAFLIMGFNIFGSAFFTALNNGRVSAIISFLRTLVLQIAAVEILPLIMGVDGIWLAGVLAEAMALIVTSGFIIGKRKQYGY